MPPLTPSTPEIVWDGPLRKFADSRIQQSMEAIVSAIPRGKRGVLIGVLTEEGVKSMAAIKLRKGWSVMGAIEREWDGDFEGEIALGTTF